MSPQPAKIVDEGDAAARTVAAVAADAAIMDEGDQLIRARPDRKPKQPVEDAATLLPQNHVQEQPNASMDQPETAQPTPDEGDVLMAEMDVHRADDIADAESSNASSGNVGPDTAADDVVPLSPGLDGAGQAKPAAHWDRMTDAVQFDWAEIERTAAQEGPNQAMAKLLVAARAEGANSRWPL